MQLSRNRFCASAWWWLVLALPSSLLRAQGTFDTIATLGNSEACSDLASDPAGNVYFLVRNESTGVVVVRKLASGSLQSSVYSPPGLSTTGGIAVDTAGDLFFVPAAPPPDRVNDGSGHLHYVKPAEGYYPVHKLSPGSTAATPLPGTGEANYVGIEDKKLLALDAAGDLYMALSGRGPKISKWSAASAAATPLPAKLDFRQIGNMPGRGHVAGPKAFVVDSEGNFFLADSDHNVIWKLTVATGLLTRFAGTGAPGFSGDGGAAMNAQINAPWGVALDGQGNLFIADTVNNRIRRVAKDTGIISTVAGNGSFRQAYVNVQGKDGTSYQRYQKQSDGDGGPPTDATISSPMSVALDASGNLYVCQGIVRKIGNSGKSAAGH